ncbi:MAG TPA: glutamine--fructose-6-phosphate transaminase (isomerizing) [Chloroflexota bacterium]
MCGIVGYSGSSPVVPLLMEGLDRLEYRGYDSAGIAVLTNSGELAIRKSVGRLAELGKLLETDSPVGTVGIGHTRWATHGRPSDENAHPHTDCTHRICVVHNGIVENYAELRDELVAQGHRMESETDTEVLAHLIEVELAKNKGGAQTDKLLSACRLALARVRGLYAIAAVSLDNPDVIVGARYRAPLVVGLADHGTLLASDIPALLSHTHKIIRLLDGDLVAATPDGALVIDSHGRQVERPTEEIEWDLSSAEREGYPHFFLKEVYEQPEALTRTLAGRLEAGRIRLPELEPIDAHRVQRILLTGCGSAFHACLMARYMFESWLHLPVDVDIASELRYRDPAINAGTLCVAVSQSGETADTLAAFELARNAGAQCLAITNVVGSAITTVGNATVLQQSGPEVAVVSSKSFTGQVAALALVGLWLGQATRRLAESRIAQVAAELEALPPAIIRALANAGEAARIGDQSAHLKSLLFLGRGIGFPTALEGALKLKEISYIQAEGYAAGELKHGPLALIEQDMTVLVVATESATREKLISNVEEVRSRGGRIIALATEGDEDIQSHADEVLWAPAAPELLSPIVNVVPLQLLAYYAAVARGCDVDKPRNLAKSVTVE